ncbi:hypothetical protein JQX08_20745, partial [Pseudomonas sp. UL073]
VLPHKHPHELLDSVVKERSVSLSPQPRPRILQQPFVPSSVFRKFLFYFNRLRFRLSFNLVVSGRRILQHPKTLSTSPKHLSNAT